MNEPSEVPGLQLVELATCFEEVEEKTSGPFHSQVGQIRTVSTVKLERRLGALTLSEMSMVTEFLTKRLCL
jgi:hypothetical protein